MKRYFQENLLRLPDSVVRKRRPSRTFCIQRQDKLLEIFCLPLIFFPRFRPVQSVSKVCGRLFPDTPPADLPVRKYLAAFFPCILGYDEEDFVVITGGKIDHAKRQTLLLIEAVKRIDNPRLKLLVFGSVVRDSVSMLFSSRSPHVKYIWKASS